MKKILLWLCLCFLMILLIAQFYSSINSVWGSNNSSLGDRPVYAGIAKYYDNRKCVVTASLDDFRNNSSAWQDSLSMLTRKNIFHTVGIITELADWNYAQYWLNQGYTEAASHSRNHVSPSYQGFDGSIPKVSYEWQINGSKNDIIGNLTLPALWRYGDKQYVYVWIEPYGRFDQTVRQLLGSSHYLCDRGISILSPTSGLASWDTNNSIFGRLGYTVEIGNPPWGGDTSVPSLNSKFDEAYRSGSIYHFISHPAFVDWSPGGYADKHTDYISNRTDVWYVPLGLLYLYNWVVDRNVTQVTSQEIGQQEYFRIGINQTDRAMFGAKYPITYVFNIPSNWTSGYVYYRNTEGNQWKIMEEKSSKDSFNGIPASRFDFLKHKVYVSAAFAESSNNTYLQILPFPLSIRNWFTSPLSVEKGKRAPSRWSVSFENGGNGTMRNASISIADLGGLQATPVTASLDDVACKATESASFAILAPNKLSSGVENVSFQVRYNDDNGLQHTESWNAPVDVAKLGTSIELGANASIVRKGNSILLTAKLLDDNENLMKTQRVSFIVGNTSLGSAITDQSGMAQMLYRANADAGTNLVTASYDESSDFLSSSRTIDLNFNKLKTNNTINVLTLTREEIAVLSAELKDENGNPVRGAVIQFQVYNASNWQNIGSSNTDTKGVACMSYILSNAGIFQIRARFSGTTNYSGSTSQTSLTEVDSHCIELYFIIAVLTIAIGANSSYILFRGKDKRIPKVH